MSPPFVFRCDATPKSGSGHVMRSLALAEAAAARGLQVGFVCRPGTVEVAPALARSRYPVTTTAPDGHIDPAAMLAGCETGRTIVVVDSYEIGRDVEHAWRPLSRGLLVLDDLADRPHDCDWLLNSAPGVFPDHYARHVAATTGLLLGPRYALVHPAVLAEREASLARRRDTSPVRRVLVAFGGTDPADGTSLALEALSAVPDIHVDVALGATAPHLGEVRRRAATIGATLHVDAPDMPRLIREADLAIGAGGSSTWERCVLGLPAIIVTIADNQRRIADSVAEAGAALSIGPRGTLDVARLREAFLDLAADPGRRSAMARRAADLIDGRGAARVLDEVLA